MKREEPARAANASGSEVGPDTSPIVPQASGPRITCPFVVLPYPQRILDACDPKKGTERLGYEALRVLVAIADHYHWGAPFSAFPTVETLAERTHLSKRHVSAGLAKLRRLGLVRVRAASPSAPHRSNEYDILPESDMPKSGTLPESDTPALPESGTETLPESVLLTAPGTGSLTAVSGERKKTGRKLHGYVDGKKAEWIEGYEPDGCSFDPTPGTPVERVWAREQLRGYNASDPRPLSEYGASSRLASAS